MSDCEDDIIDDEFDDEEHEYESLSAALAAEWGSAPWYVSSIGIHLALFLILFLIPISPPAEPEPVLDLTTTQIVEEENEEEEEEKPEVEVVEKEEIDQEIAETPVDVPQVVETEIEITDQMETEDEVDDATAAGDPDDMATFDSEFTGTPALMGVGASGGGGGGRRFGNRGRGGRKKALMKGGGTKKTESAVNWALEWLAAHQEPDGHWGSAKYGGSPGPSYDVAVTGLAMLAFLGAGNSVGFGKYKNTVKTATRWLMSYHRKHLGNSIGCVNYPGGIGLMAIAESYGMSEDHPMAKEIGVVAQQCVDWAVKSQNENGSFDYHPNSKRSDQSVSGWLVMGLKSAYVSGLKVPQKTFKKSLRFHRKWTTDKGNSGYNAAGVGTHRMKAVANTCLQFLGDPRSNKKVVATARQLIKVGNLPGDKKGTAKKEDFYLMYYQSLGLFQMGVKSQYWKVFNPKMKEHLLGTQVMVGRVQNKKGSWNYAEDIYGDRWGRVGQTALAALMLEVYYRYKEGSKVGKGGGK